MSDQGRAIVAGLLSGLAAVLADAGKFPPHARCENCARHPSVPVRVFTETARVLRTRLGPLPPAVLNLPLFDVRCREGKCKNNVPVLVGDLLGYS